LTANIKGERNDLKEAVDFNNLTLRASILLVAVQKCMEDRLASFAVRMRARAVSGNNGSYLIGQLAIEAKAVGYE
jgi:hypothetical protein